MTASTILTPDAIAAVDRALAAGRKAEIIPTDNGVIVKEVTQKTVYKTVDRTETDRI